ncbi:MAG: hypothetical protein HQM04_17790 [Magnetococcales bacterium]|nr:hypothetical protein [Magnetococcales bacterium]MBF0116882.1 hypothetical protein [Magnetococcales bacterium]
MVGGFLGRKGSGEPVVKVILQGLQQVMTGAQVLRWVRQHPG